MQLYILGGWGYISYNGAYRGRCSGREKAYIRVKSLRWKPQGWLRWCCLSQTILILISFSILLFVQASAASCPPAQAAVLRESARTAAHVSTCWSAGLNASVRRAATRSPTARWPCATSPRTPSWPSRASASAFTSPSLSRKHPLLLLFLLPCNKLELTWIIYAAPSFQ